MRHNLTKQIFTHLENTLSLNKKSFAGIMRKVHSKLNLSAYFSNNPRSYTCCTKFIQGYATYSPSIYKYVIHVSKKQNENYIFFPGNNDTWRTLQTGLLR